jgi:hypothetical protein
VLALDATTTTLGLSGATPGGLAGGGGGGGAFTEANTAASHAALSGFPIAVYIPGFTACVHALVDPRDTRPTTVFVESNMGPPLSPAHEFGLLALTEPHGGAYPKHASGPTMDAAHSV